MSKEIDVLNVSKLIADCFILNKVDHYTGITAMMGVIAMSIKASGASFDYYLKFMHQGALEMRPLFDEEDND